jgi:hypothetical protein
MLEPKWYTTNEMIFALRPIMTEIGITGAEFNEFIADILSTLDMPPETYSVDSNSLILVSAVDGVRSVSTFARR